MSSPSAVQFCVDYECVWFCVINFSTFALQTQTEILANITVTELSDSSVAASIQFGVHRYTVFAIVRTFR